MIKQNPPVFVLDIIILRVYSKPKGKTANLNKINVLSFGINKYTGCEDINEGTHAEHDALLALNKKTVNTQWKNVHDKKNRKIEIHLLVVRFSKLGRLQNSKPCHHCILRMKTLPETMGYKLKYIYYSTQNETIAKTSLRELFDEEDHHYTRLYSRLQRDVSIEGHVNTPSDRFHTTKYKKRK